MTETLSTALPHVDPALAPEPTTQALATRPGRWIDHWTLRTSTSGRPRPPHRAAQPQLVDLRGVPRLRRLAALVDRRRDAARGRFDLSTGEIFWLISIPSLVGATLRIPYSFLVPKFGGRNWTIISAGLLLAADDRARRLRLQPRDAVRRAARRGGPRRLRRRQLRQLDVEHHLLLPAEGEGLGARTQCGRRQPRCLGRAVRRADRHHDRRRGNAEPARRRLDLDPVHPARDVRRRPLHGQPLQRQGRLRRFGRRAKEPHLWLISLLYIGTFGSFIGFASVFPKLIADQFPEFSAIARGRGSVSLAFLGALVGSLARRTAGDSPTGSAARASP